MQCVIGVILAAGSLAMPESPRLVQIEIEGHNPNFLSDGL